MGTGIALTMAGLSLAKGVGDFNASKSEARRLKTEAEIKMKTRRKEIQKLIAEQKVGYGQAGVELEGTPQAIIQSTYNTGIEDINAIADSYNRTIKNTIVKAKANLLGSIAGSGVQAYSAYGKHKTLSDYRRISSEPTIWDSLTSWDWASNPFANRIPYDEVTAENSVHIPAGFDFDKQW
jgi:hypothetical protein